MIHNNYATFKTAIIMRDKGICQSCKNRFPVGSLSAHHIIPRPEGSNDDENGICLCYACHDEIEGLGLSRDLLVNWYHCRTSEESKERIDRFIQENAIDSKEPLGIIRPISQPYNKLPTHRSLLDAKTRRDIKKEERIIKKGSRKFKTEMAWRKYNSNPEPSTDDVEKLSLKLDLPYDFVYAHYYDKGWRKRIKQIRRNL